MIDQYGNEISWLPNLGKKKEPKYISIATCIEEDITKGILEAGFRLPPQRIIANYLGINHTTVTRAYRLCEEKGLIKGVTGKGTFVTSHAGIPQNLLTENNSNIIEMGMVLPLYEQNKLIESYLKEIYHEIDYSEVLSYVPPEGHIKHRYITSKWLRQFDLDCPTEQIIITSGSQNALAVILTSLFKRGDRIIVDEYTYTGLITLSRLLGIILIPVKTNEDGIDIDDLNATCSRENAKGIYLIPDCHNPTTAVIPNEKRKEIGQIIIDHNLLLIEENLFIFANQNPDTRPISDYAKDNSIFIVGTSKSINPAFRISYIVSPKKHVNELTHGLNSLSWMTSPLNAEILAHILNTSKYNQIVSEKLSLLKKRNQLVDTILCDYRLIPNERSLYRYLALPSSISDKEIEHSCLREGVQVFSSKRFAAGTQPNKNGIRLSVSGPKSIEELMKGLEILRNVLKTKSKASPII